MGKPNERWALGIRLMVWVAQAKHDPTGEQQLSRASLVAELDYMEPNWRKYDRNTESQKPIEERVKNLLYHQYKARDLEPDPWYNYINGPALWGLSYHLYNGGTVGSWPPMVLYHEQLFETLGDLV